MGKIAQLVMGPAGSGKSTYCEHMQRHCEMMRRTTHVFNLDPAAEHFKYSCSIGSADQSENQTVLIFHILADIRNLVTLSDAMDEMQFGPNGGLVFCLESVSSPTFHLFIFLSGTSWKIWIGWMTNWMITWMTTSSSTVLVRALGTRIL